MPTVPNLPPEKLGSASANGLPTDPANFLLAAADLHQSGELSSPVPAGHPLQTGKPIAKARGRSRIQVVK